MAGTRLELTMDDRVVQQAFQDLLRRSGTLEPALRDIGESLINSTRQRFEDQEGPDGEPWEPLSPTTLGLKPKNTDKILIQEGDLMRDLVPQVTDDSLEITNNRIYAAMQQFGGQTSPDSMIPNRTIPARPFLGFSATDEQDILAIARDHLAGAFE